MPADIIQKIYAAPTASADSVVAVDVPQDGHIESMFYTLRGVGMDAHEDTVRFELSFASSNTFDNNDARISILDDAVTQQLLTTGGGNLAHSNFVSGIDIPVFAGERLHVHYTESGTPSGAIITIYLYYRVRGGAPPRRSARRR